MAAKYSEYSNLLRSTYPLSTRSFHSTQECEYPIFYYVVFAVPSLLRFLFKRFEFDFFL